MAVSLRCRAATVMSRHLTRFWCVKACRVGGCAIVVREYPHNALYVRHGLLYFGRLSTRMSCGAVARQFP